MKDNNLDIDIIIFILGKKYRAHIYHEGIFYYIWSLKKLMNWLQ